MKHSAGTWLSVLNHFPSSDPASLDQVSHWKPDPPALVERRPLGTGVDTHRQPKSAQAHGKVASSAFSQKMPACCWIMSLLDEQPDKLFSRCRCGVGWKSVGVDCAESRPVHRGSRSVLTYP